MSTQPAPATAPPPDRDEAVTEVVEPRLLERPAEGVPEVVVDRAGLDAVVAALTAGSGPLAVDAERAHGFRYSQRAYLIQLRREGSGSHLIDPIALAPEFDGELGMPDLSPIAAAVGGSDWIIHAASQDLPCLVELSLVPTALFDSELAGRLLGFPRVNLSTLLEELFGIRLRKEHSAADWSSRPLPPEWLVYAALDVELLVQLAEELQRRLVDAGKDEWARQEFAHLVATATRPLEPRADPWRRTSGIHKVRTRRGLAVVEALWAARDEIARSNDRAPGRILSDHAISELAQLRSPRRESLREIEFFHRRHARRYEQNWVNALEQALALPESALPPLHLPVEGPPHPRTWANRDPEAAARLARVRPALQQLSEELHLPVENLLTPDYVRRLAWEPPADLSAESIDAELTHLGARPWQRELTAALIADHLRVPPEPPAPPTPTGA